MSETYHSRMLKRPYYHGSVEGNDAALRLAIEADEEIAKLKEELIEVKDNDMGTWECLQWCAEAVGMSLVKGEKGYNAPMFINDAVQRVVAERNALHKMLVKCKEALAEEQTLTEVESSRLDDINTLLD